MMIEVPFTAAHTSESHHIGGKATIYNEKEAKNCEKCHEMHAIDCTRSSKVDTLEQRQSVVINRKLNK